ncbi:MAG: rhomboid family intramembrane serine protease [Pontibacterium sp.]
MIRVLDVSLSEDLSEFTAFLWQHEIPHRILEADERQQLWVARTVDPQKIAHLYELWKQGTDLSRIQVSFHASATNTVAVSPGQVWLTISLIILSLAISFLVGMGENFDNLRLFTITDVEQRQEHIYSTDLMETFYSGEIWRLITPVFIHFGLMHVLFNLLWVWVVGSKVEYFQGWRVLLGLVVFSGLVSNLAQYFISGPLFGGMSGVVFALLAYAWLWDKRNPQSRIGLPTALMGFMVVWLALGYLGILEGLGFGAIANTAHLAGLVSGLLFVSLGERLARRRQSS